MFLSKSRVKSIYRNGNKENETPGKYASGTIVANYTQGQTIEVAVQITTNHKGWFQFKLCENNDLSMDKSQECFDRWSNTNFHLKTCL